MIPARFRPSRILTISFLIIGLLLVIGGLVATWYVREQLTLRLKDAGIAFESIQVNPLTRSIALTGVKWMSKGDSLQQTSPHEISTKYFRLKGIGIIGLLRSRKLAINTLVLEDAHILIHRNPAPTSQTTTTDTTLPLSSIEIDHLVVKNVAVEIKRDTLTEYSGTLTFSLTSVALDDARSFSFPSAYTVKEIKFELDQFRMDRQGGVYSLRCHKLSFNSQEQKLMIDSLALHPRYGKQEFSKVVGRQVSRMEIMVPQIEAIGVSGDIQMQDSLIMARKLVLSNATVLAYRDKRIPFRQKEEVPLPMEMFRELSIAIDIDTIQLINANITYEHFPEDGFRPGRLTFSNMDALLQNVNNLQYYNKSKFASIDAHANLMGSGMIYAELKFPLQKGNAYHASGKIVKVPLPDLNPMLEYAAFTRIESGVLEEMKFDFDFNNEGSKGTAQLDYRDLRLVSLHKERNASINSVKTALVNAAIQNKKDREGSIQVARDKKRYIFHFLAASLMDGVKSAVVPMAPTKAKEK